MTSRAEPLGPELREVLLDIARDPRSTLFRVTTTDVQRSVTDEVPPVSARSAGWTSAARYLIRGFREKVALLLRNAFRATLHELDGPPRRFAFSEPRHKRAEMPTRAELRGEANRVLGSERSKNIDPSVASVLASLGPGNGGRATLSQLAHAALRLEPNDSTRILQAADCIFHSKLDEARAILFGVVQTTNDNIMKSLAFSNIALATSLGGDKRLAYEYFARASNLWPTCSLELVNCFVKTLSFISVKLVQKSIELFVCHVFKLVL